MIHKRFFSNFITGVVLLSVLLSLFSVIGITPAYACYSWQVGARVGLRGGAEIRTGSGLGYPAHTIVPNDNWQVDIIGGPRQADGKTWWNVSRQNLDGGGTGWVYIEQAGYDLCGSGGGGGGQSGGPSGYTFCADEGGYCSFSGLASVAYGANGKFAYRNNVNGGIACKNDVFGDPIQGTVKACYYKITGSPPTATPVPPSVSPPSLASPGNGSSYSQSTAIVLRWNTSANATRYKVELWGGPYSKMTPCNWQGGTSCTIGTMWPGTMYWHVKARDASGRESAWSATWSFTIQEIAATNTPVPPSVSPPSLASPGNGSSYSQSTAIVLRWNTSANATRYKVELWGGPYSKMTPCNWQGGTSCTIGTMWPGTMYWHVKARDASGRESAWSATWSFTIWEVQATSTPVPPPLPSVSPTSLSSPGNGSPTLASPSAPSSPTPSRLSTPEPVHTTNEDPNFPQIVLESYSSDRTVIVPLPKPKAGYAWVSARFVREMESDLLMRKHQLEEDISLGHQIEDAGKDALKSIACEIDVSKFDFRMQVAIKIICVTDKLPWGVEKFFDWEISALRMELVPQKLAELRQVNDQIASLEGTIRVPTNWHGKDYVQVPVYPVIDSGGLTPSPNIHEWARGLLIEVVKKIPAGVVEAIAKTMKIAKIMKIAKKIVKP